MTAPLAELLTPDSVVLEASAVGRDDAVRQAGRLLVEAGAVDPEYVEAMLDREHAVSTYLGEGVAVPHGTLASTATVHRDALVLLRFEDAVAWSGEQVTIVIGLAAPGTGHVRLLSRLATVLLDPTAARALHAASTLDEVRAVFV